MKIGAFMGSMKSVAIAEDDVGWGRRLRVKVSINLYQPFDRGRALNLSEKSYWVPFKYEKLPRFCFKCGRILHDQKGCLVQSVPQQNHAEGKPAWGPWLRAEESSRGVSPLEDHKEEGYTPPVLPVARGGATKTRANTKKEMSQNRDYGHVMALRNIFWGFESQ
jgi:hypothetical protein